MTNINADGTAKCIVEMPGFEPSILPELIGALLKIETPKDVLRSGLPLEIQRWIFNKFRIDTFVNLGGVSIEPEFKNCIDSGAMRIIPDVYKYKVGKFAEEISKHIEFLGEGSRNNTDWLTAEEVFWDSIGGIIRLVHAAQLVTISEVYQSETGNGMPKAITESSRDIFKELGRMVEHLKSLPSDRLAKLIEEAGEKMPGDLYLLNLILGRGVWEGFLLWARPRFYTGPRYGIKLPSYYKANLADCP